MSKKDSSLKRQLASLGGKLDELMNGVEEAEGDSQNDLDFGNELRDVKEKFALFSKRMESIQVDQDFKRRKRHLETRKLGFETSKHFEGDEKSFEDFDFSDIYSNMFSFLSLVECLKVRLVSKLFNSSFLHVLTLSGNIQMFGRNTQVFGRQIKWKNDVHKRIGRERSYLPFFYKFVDYRKNNVKTLTFVDTVDFLINCYLKNIIFKSLTRIVVAGTDPEKNKILRCFLKKKESKIAFPNLKENHIVEVPQGGTSLALEYILSVSPGESCELLASSLKKLQRMRFSTLRVKVIGSRPLEMKEKIFQALTELKASRIRKLVLDGVFEGVIQRYFLDLWFPEIVLGSRKSRSNCSYPTVFDLSLRNHYVRKLSIFWKVKNKFVLKCPNLENLKMIQYNKICDVDIDCYNLESIDVFRTRMMFRPLRSCFQCNSIRIQSNELKTVCVPRFNQLPKNSFVLGNIEKLTIHVTNLKELFQSKEIGLRIRKCLTISNYGSGSCELDPLDLVLFLKNNNIWLSELQKLVIDTESKKLRLNQKEELEISKYNLKSLRKLSVLSNSGYIPFQYLSVLFPRVKVLKLCPSAVVDISVTKLDQKRFWKKIRRLKMVNSRTTPPFGIFQCCKDSLRHLEYRFGVGTSNKLFQINLVMKNLRRLKLVGLTLSEKSVLPKLRYFHQTTIFGFGRCHIPNIAMGLKRKLKEYYFEKIHSCTKKPKREDFPIEITGVARELLKKIGKLGYEDSKLVNMGKRKQLSLYLRYGKAEYHLKYYDVVKKAEQRLLEHNVNFFVVCES